LLSFARIPEQGNINSRGLGYVEAMLGRGVAFNYVYSASGELIDPENPDPPQKYWKDARHVAIVWPYVAPLAVPDGKGGYTTGANVVIGPYVLNLDSEGDRQQASNADDNYIYSKPPWHDRNNSDNDMCIPVALAPNLLKVVNFLYEQDANAQVH